MIKIVMSIYVSGFNDKQIKESIMKNINFLTIVRFK